MIYDEIIKRVNAYIIEKNDNKLLDVLEKEQSSNNLSGDLQVLLGLVLMMPPFADYQCALEAFKSAQKTDYKDVAAIWHGYLHTTLYPIDSSFARNLNLSTGEGLYILSLHNCANNSPEWRNNLTDSIAVKKFPNNLRFYLRTSKDLSADIRKNLSSEAIGMVIDSSFEKSSQPNDYKKLMANYWDELILGKCMASGNWEAFKKEVSLNQSS